MQGSCDGSDVRPGKKSSLIAPAQIRTGGITAYGPHLGGIRAMLLPAHRAIPGTLTSRTVSGWCWIERCSPWPASLFLQAPPKIALLCRLIHPRSLSGRGAPEVSRFSVMLFLSVRGF